MKRIKILLFLLLFIFQTLDSHKRDINTLSDKSDYYSVEFINNIVLYDIKHKVHINDTHLYYMEICRKYYNIPVHIYYRLIYAESRFIHNIKSSVGATGYMQVMPSTFKWLKTEFKDLNLLDINNPYNNIKAGTFYLYYLKNNINSEYPNNSETMKWKRVLASYNAGYFVHNKAMRTYSETKKYIQFIIPIKVK